MFSRSVLTVGAGVLCVCTGAHAHHSRALYDLSAEAVIEGTVTTLVWHNPHISMTVETTGADGARVLQEIEVMSVSEAKALGLPQEAIAPGAHVVARVHPGRRGPGSRALGLDVRTGDGTLLPLNTDSGVAIAPSVASDASSLEGNWAPSVADFETAFMAMLTWPLTDTARASLQAAMGKPDAVLGICADFPPPTLSVFPDLREIAIGDSAVVMRFEAQGQNVERVVHLDQSAHPADVAPSLMGHSIGRWDNGSLVIDTVAFAPHSIGITFAVPSGPAKHLVERLTLAADRRHLRYELTLEDPLGLTAPASINMQWDYRPDLEPSGVACDPEAARRILQ